MFYLKKPDDFNPILEASGCIIENDGKILLLHRQIHRPEGGTWGLPAGKIEPGERAEDTIIRETKEETGLEIGSGLVFFKKAFVRYPAYDSIFHIFHFKASDKKEIILDPNEHKDYKWASPKEALTMPLIGDLDSCIKLFFGL